MKLKNKKDKKNNYNDLKQKYNKVMNELEKFKKLNKDLDKTIKGLLQEKEKVKNRQDINEF